MNPETGEIGDLSLFDKLGLADKVDRIDADEAMGLLFVPPAERAERLKRMRAKHRQGGMGRGK